MGCSSSPKSSSPTLTLLDILACYVMTSIRVGGACRPFINICDFLSGETMQEIHHRTSVKFKKDSLFSAGQQGERVCEGEAGQAARTRVRLLLNAADGLDLRGLRVRAKLPEVLILPTVTVTLHDVLVATVARVLVAHKTVEWRQDRTDTHR